MILFFFISFFISALLIPFIIRFSRKYGFYDKVNSRKIHSGNIPRLGGLAVVFSFIVTEIIFGLFYSTPVADRIYNVSLIFAGILIFFMGLTDDFHPLRAGIKLIIQCVAALITIVCGYSFDSILGFYVPPFIGNVFTFLWIVFVINSYNLIDGLDGLCGGLSFLTLGALYIIFARSASSAAALCLVLCGSIAGFLLYNKPPAKIFLGDGGSQFLGFFVAVCPLFSSTVNYEYNKVLIMLTLCAIPMTDTLAAVWRRTREHRSVFSPDMGHIHHKLVNIGFTKQAALLFLLSMQALICISVGLAMYLQVFNGTILIVVTYAFVLLFFSVLHYINRAVNRQNKGTLFGKQSGDEDTIK
ncbi:undecaprenyl/decaprenyl-phosphate alpha-N-acetylglucosaminyl 1-phosphate transferase [Treponema parvum]|uniref:Undecaprenyl/decaprenyl-phosphate alpha-N-acetylglucosaminyl 1-phosphate transferase n=1 Tax=Treponema parvum TaxID=138851 RepID=A0A975F3W6_9SPIR|nr:MraY family glycosyltransferase [Treponema parvum]QTQ13818.1 undecaprenyl/decaprenyl-phosphate alpha-N-acetylglucosaminyl 1-phosphate transferase [Treponema parvum]